MKKLLLSGLLSVLFFSITYAQYDDVYYDSHRSGYEGDYFSLEGALDLFKQSYSLRDFERKLNTEENWVNNLDLNYDGRIDYIRVEHKRRGNFHAIIMQAVLDRYDVQDVAVIEIDVIGRGEAILQIVGDEDLYGEEVVVEPVEGYSNSRRGYHSDYGSYVNVYYWNTVRDFMEPQYIVYVSPYYWHYYPTWWSPWRQCSWNVYRPRVVVYHRHYHVIHRHRVIHVHDFYRTHRQYSYTVVQHANKVRVEHGKAPIHRPAPDIKQEQRKDRVVEQPRNSTGSRTASPNPSVSRERTTPSSSTKETRNSTARTDQRPPGSVSSPRTSRPTTPDTRSSASSSKSTRSYDQKPDRGTSTQTRTQTRSTTTPSSTSSPRPSNNARTSTSTKSGETSRVQQQPRSTTRPSTTTRTQTTTSKPSVRSSTPSSSGSKSNATRSGASKGSSPKSSSKN